MASSSQLLRLLDLHIHKIVLFLQRELHFLAPRVYILSPYVHPSISTGKVVCPETEGELQTKETFKIAITHFLQFCASKS